MKIKHIQTAIPVYIKVEIDGYDDTIFALIDVANKTVDIPENKDQEKLGVDIVEFKNLVFEYYDNLNNYQIEIPDEVYEQFNKSHQAQQKINERRQRF